MPLQDLVDKFSHVRFEPSGMTKNPDVRFAKSIVDYIFRWMATKFLSADAQFRVGVNNREEVVTTPEQLPLDVAAAAGRVGDGRHRLAEDVVFCGDAEPGRRAAVLDVRLDHGAQRLVLQVLELVATKFLSADAQFRVGVNNREEVVTTPEQLPLDVAAAAGASATAVIASAEDVIVCGDAEPGGRAAVLDVRVDHGAQRLVLQVLELRHDVAGARDSRQSAVVSRESQSTV